MAPARAVVRRAVAWLGLAGALASAGCAAGVIGAAIGAASGGGGGGGGGTAAPQVGEFVRDAVGFVPRSTPAEDRVVVSVRSPKISEPPPEADPDGPAVLTPLAGRVPSQILEGRSTLVPLNSAQGFDAIVVRVDNAPASFIAVDLGTARTEVDLELEFDDPIGTTRNSVSQLVCRFGLGTARREGGQIVGVDGVGEYETATFQVGTVEPPVVDGAVPLDELEILPLPPGLAARVGLFWNEPADLDLFVIGEGEADCFISPLFTPDCPAANPLFATNYGDAGCDLLGRTLRAEQVDLEELAVPGSYRVEIGFFAFCPGETPVDVPYRLVIQQAGQIDLDVAGVVPATTVPETPSVADPVPFTIEDAIPPPTDDDLVVTLSWDADVDLDLGVTVPIADAQGSYDPASCAAIAGGAPRAETVTIFAAPAGEYLVTVIFQGTCFDESLTVTFDVNATFGGETRLIRELTFDTIDNVPGAADQVVFTLPFEP